MHFCVSLWVKVVAIYALLACRIFGPKIWPCKIFDKYHVCVNLTKSWDIFGSIIPSKNFSAEAYLQGVSRHNGTKALSTLTHSTLLLQSRSLNKLFLLSWSNLRLVLFGKGREIQGTTLTNITLWNPYGN